MGVLTDAGSFDFATDPLRESVAALRMTEFLVLRSDVWLIFYLKSGAKKFRLG